LGQLSVEDFENNMWRKLLILIMLILSSQASLGESADKPITSELASDFTVSRLEFSLQNIKNELQQEFRGDNRFSFFLNEILVGAGFDEPSNRIGVIIDTSCKPEKSLGQKQIPNIADQLAKDIFIYFGNWGKHEATNAFDENMLHLNLGQKFSRNLYSPPSDKSKLLEIGKRIAEHFVVNISVRCKGAGASYTYKLNTNYSNSSPVFTDQDRKLNYQF
jgi:hypothetical protein